MSADGLVIAGTGNYSPGGGPAPVTGEVFRWIESEGVRGLDGDVDAADLNNLALNWLSTNGVTWGGGDFNGDRNVNAVDLNELAMNWRHTVAGDTIQLVPEPGALALISISAFVMMGSLLRRRRVPSENML